MRKTQLLIAAAALAAGLGVVVPASAASERVGTASTAHPAAPSPCAYTAQAPADSFKGLPQFDPAAAAQPYTARLHTSQGQITIRALTDKAPCTTFSFRFLAERSYFNRTHCHRLTTQRIFVLQCGDPTGTGSGGPGYVFPDENLTGATYPAGTIGMANAGPNTNGSQFFFVWKDTKLSPAYTPFAVVTAGMDVLQKIATAGEDDQNSAGDGYPSLFVEIRHVKISTR